MPGGRQKNPGKLTHVEISRRSPNKRKQEDPEGRPRRIRDIITREKIILISNSKTRKLP